MSKVHKSFEIVMGNTLPYIIRDTHSRVIPLGRGEADDEAWDEGSKAAGAEIREAELEAGRIMEDARRQAEEMIQSARREAEKEKNQAREEGYREGYETGYGEALRQTEKELEAVRQIRRQTLVQREKMLDELENEVLDLSLEVAEKILTYELDRNEDAFRSILSRALDRVRTKGEISLRVSPREFEYACSIRDSLLAKAGGIKNMEIIPDRSMDRGACIVESPGGNLDAGIQSQLAKIEAAFRQLAGNEA